MDDTKENKRPNRPSRPANPWYERARKRLRLFGGQYKSSKADGLSAEMESLLQFEHERALASGAVEVSPW